MMERVFRDFRYALRGLRKSPGFALGAVSVLALGLGACAAMFSMMNVVLLRPLPFLNPERLVWIENLGRGQAGLSERTSRADIVIGWREQTTTLASIAAYFAFSDYVALTLTGRGDPERLRGLGVSDNFLPTLGIEPLYGRNFNAAESVFGGPGAVILSHDFWRRRFGGDPAIVGESLTLNQRPATVIGVLPETFDFDAVFTPGSQVDLLNVFPLSEETAQYGNTVFAVGRLKPGARVDQAQADLTLISDRLRAANPVGGVFGARVSALDESVRGRFRRPFLILGAAVLFVLVIACMNLSGLLLARLHARSHEFAVRLSLGARPRHFVGQALAESLLLAFAGSALGLPLAIWATSRLALRQTFGVPLLSDAAVDAWSVAVTVGLSALAGLACGLLPALLLSRHLEGRPGQGATHQRSSGRSAGRARSGLIVAEVALACILLVGAGLLFRSFEALMKVDLGFEPRQAMSFRIDPQRDFKDGAGVQQYLGELKERIAALPGVAAVGLSDTLPLGRNRNWGAGAVGVQYEKGKYPSAYPRMIDPDYLQAMGIRLVAGRPFERAYDPATPKAVIINESLARTLWPGSDPLGLKVAVNGESVVIGVVEDVRHRALEQAGGNEMYLDYRQALDWSVMEMVVRSERPPESLVPEIRGALAAYDPGLPSGEHYELERLVDDAVAPRQLLTRLLEGFSALALLLATIGLYSIVAYSVAQRRQEIGIRMAIGARRGDVLRLVLRGGLRLGLLGILLGLIGSLALSRVLRSQLFGISGQDPLTFAGIGALLLSVALLASLVPGLRAARVNPVVALRVD